MLGAKLRYFFGVCDYLFFFRVWTLLIRVRLEIIFLSACTDDFLFLNIFNLILVFLSEFLFVFYLFMAGLGYFFESRLEKYWVLVVLFLFLQIWIDLIC